MATTPKERTRAREKTRRYRARLRAAGLRPIQIWVPDTAAKGFANEARRQSLRASRAPGETEVLDFIDAVQADNSGPDDTDS